MSPPNLPELPKLTTVPAELHGLSISQFLAPRDLARYGQASRQFRTAIQDYGLLRFRIPNDYTPDFSQPASYNQHLVADLPANFSKEGDYLIRYRLTYPGLVNARNFLYIYQIELDIKEGLISQIRSWSNDSRDLTASFSDREDWPVLLSSINDLSATTTTIQLTRGSREVPIFHQEQPTVIDLESGRAQLLEVSRSTLIDPYYYLPVGLAFLQGSYCFFLAGRSLALYNTLEKFPYFLGLEDQATALTRATSGRFFQAGAGRLIGPRYPQLLKLYHQQSLARYLPGVMISQAPDRNQESIQLTEQALIYQRADLVITIPLEANWLGLDWQPDDQLFPITSVAWLQRLGLLAGLEPALALTFTDWQFSNL